MFVSSATYSDLKYNDFSLQRDFVSSVEREGLIFRVPTPLIISPQQAIARQAREGMTTRSLDDPLPSHAPDSSRTTTYRLVSMDHSLRDIFPRKVQAAVPARLFGSNGSRLTRGNSSELNAIEAGFRHFFGAPSASLFSSSFSANVAFLPTVPQKTDVIIYDELVHTSCREGICVLSRPSYRFHHNSVASCEKCFLGVLQKHLQIIRETFTVFIVLESLYSMNGDIFPLTETVGLVQTLVPAGHPHIVVDEARTSRICGPNGAGYVSEQSSSYQCPYVR